MSELTDKRVCLSIAGLDPSGGAGVLADIKAFNAFGCFGTAAVTSVTFQNTQGVFGAEHITGDAVRKQVEPIFDDFSIAAVKTGMLPTADVIDAVAGLMAARSEPLVVDPVVRSTSGFDLIDDEALRVLIDKLFPLAAIVTPNLAEAERIVGFPLGTESDADRAAMEMLEMGARAVLIKGGHRLSHETQAIDRLYVKTEPRVDLKAEWIDSTATHGTGCVLSAAIAAGLANGRSLKEAVTDAKEFVTNAIRTSPGLGRGHSPTNI